MIVSDLSSVQPVFKSVDSARGQVLLLHGLTGSSMEMEALAEMLHQLKFSVKAPQLAGHRATLTELRNTDHREWLKQVEAEVEELQQQPLILIGLSFGALLALHAAEAFPSKVRAVVVLSPTLSLRSKFAHLLLSLLSYLPEPLPSFFGFKVKQAARESKLVLPRMTFGKHSIAALIRLFKIRRRVLSRLGLLRIPVLFIQDPDDHHLSPQGVNRLSPLRERKLLQEMWIPGGEHEITIGPMHTQLFKAVQKFVEAIP